MKRNNFKIAVFAGDGVGPEIMKEALKILKLISGKKNINLQLAEGLVGGSAYDNFGVPLPERALIWRCKAMLSCSVPWVVPNGRRWIIV